MVHKITDPLFWINLKICISFNYPTQSSHHSLHLLVAPPAADGAQIQPASLTLLTLGFAQLETQYLPERSRPQIHWSTLQGTSILSKICLWHMKLVATYPQATSSKLLRRCAPATHRQAAETTDPTQWRRLYCRRLSPHASAYHVYRPILRRVFLRTAWFA